MLPNCVKEFLDQGHEHINKITPQDITAYYQYLQERPNKRRAGGLSESFINHHIYSLKLFFAWQIEIAQLINNPISILTFPSPQSKPREILSLPEIKQLYEVAESHKEKAILSLYYGAGLRRSEGEQLNLKDIHFRNNLLYVREGKGKKRRAVPLSCRVASDIKNYIYNERYAKENETAVITNKRGKRISGASCNTILKTMLERITISKEITLHNLRHSIATHLLESGLSIEYIRDFLGHKHLESTQIYTRVNQKQLHNL